TNDGTQSIVTVNIPPKSGDYAAPQYTGYAEVLVQFNQPRNFSKIFGSGTIPVYARSVALGAPIAGDVGILVLDPTTKDSLNTQGSGTTTVAGTPVIVDSNNAEAAIGGGGGQLVAPEFDISCGCTTTGAAPFGAQSAYGL